MKKISLLIICGIFYSCNSDNWNIEDMENGIMTSHDVDSYVILSNHFDKNDNFQKMLPYSLKMQSGNKVGFYDFFHVFLKIKSNDNVFDDKIITKLEKPEQEYLLYVLKKGALCGDDNCKEQLIKYYRNGIGVEKSDLKADSIVKTFGYPKT